MTPQDTLKFLADRYQLDLNGPQPIPIHHRRWQEVGGLLHNIGAKKAVELGVYKGSFTQTIASRTPNMELIGIDAWTSYEGYIDYPVGHLENVAEVEARTRCAKHPNIKLIKGWSKDVAPTFEDESLDYIFIDSNHSYESCIEDLGLWVKKVKFGGIVMGHDYFDTKTRNRFKMLDFGVIQAVNEWVYFNGIKHLFLWDDNFPSWMFVRGDV